MRARICAAFFVLLSASACTVESPEKGAARRQSPAEALLPHEELPPPVEGISAAILVDTSGSMKDSVPDAQGQMSPKILIAKGAVLETLRHFEEFATRNPERKVMVGIFEFSSRGSGSDWCREVVPFGPPNVQAARAAVLAMHPDGATPIGGAMVRAKQALDRTGLRRQHILVVTDGQNNRGYAPGDIARAIEALPEERRSMLHFIAFDISAENFRAVQDAGGLVLEAGNERDLRQTLDFVLTGRILAEQPGGAPAK